MYKKSLVLVSVVLFVLCIFSNFVFATDNVKNAVSNVANTVVDGANRLGSDVRNGVGSVENGVEGALKLDNAGTNAVRTDTSRMDNTDKAGTTGGYTATRTTANAATTDNASTLWIWLIVAIAAIVIIGLVWYYGNQNRTHNDE